MRRIKRLRSGRARYSLASLLLVAALAASLIANIFTSIRMRAVITERDRLRAEVGFLAETDASEIAAVRVPADEPLSWKFRLRVPAAARYRVACGTFWPSGAAQPDWRGGLVVPGGESTLIVQILRDSRDDRWKLSAIIRDSETTKRLSIPLEERQVALFRQSTDTLGTGVGSSTVSVMGDRPLRVLDQRWLSGDGGLLLYGDRPPDMDIDGVFAEIQTDRGPLNP